MKRAFRILGIVVAIVVVLIVGLMVAAKILITPERIRAAVLPRAEAALHRQVELGEINVSLFRGITLQGLKVHERAGEESFIAADEVVLRYQLWPILFKRVVIDEIRLEAPTIRVERLADGSFNFSDLLPAAAETAGAGAPAESRQPGEGLPVDLLVSTVSIREGLVRFLDRMVSSSAPLEYRIEGLDLSANDISPTSEFPFTLQARIAEAPLKVEGSVNPAGPGGRAKVSLSGLNVAAFSPYFAAKLPGKLGSLKLSLDLEAAGDAAALTSNGRIDLQEIDLTLDALPDAPLRGSSASLDYRVKADLPASRLQIEESTAAFNGIALRIAGAVENLADAPKVDLTVTVPDLELRKTITALPPGLVSGVKGLDPAGTVNIEAHLAGGVDQPAKLLQEAEVRLDGVQANAGGLRPAVSGLLTLKGETLSSRDLTLAAGDNRAAIDLKAENVLGRPIRVESRIKADRFELQPLLQATAAPAAAATPEAPAGKPAAPKAPAGPAEEVGPFDLPLRVDGTVQIGSTLYKGLTVDDFDLHFLLENNVLNVDRLTGKVAKGSFDQTARIDLGRKGLAYSTRLGLKEVQADPVVTAFFPKAGGTVFGTLNLNADLQGRGTLPEALKRNLSGNGSFLITDGKLTGAGLVQDLADFVNLEALRVIRFSQAKGTFTVANGKVQLNSDFSGGDARFSPRGTVGLDGALDVALDLRLSPELTARLDRGGNVAQFFTDAEGWGQVPLKVAGNVSSPRFAFDSSAVKSKVKEKAREEIEKQLQEKVLEKLAPREGEKQSPEQEKSKKAIEDALKGLLGR